MTAEGRRIKYLEVDSRLLGDLLISFCNVEITSKLPKDVKCVGIKDFSSPYYPGKMAVYFESSEWEELPEGNAVCPLPGDTIMCTRKD